MKSAEKQTMKQMKVSNLRSLFSLLLKLIITNPINK